MRKNIVTTSNLAPTTLHKLATFFSLSMKPTQPLRTAVERLVTKVSLLLNARKVGQKEENEVLLPKKTGAFTKRSRNISAGGTRNIDIWSLSKHNTFGSPQEDGVYYAYYKPQARRKRSDNALGAMSSA